MASTMFSEKYSMPIESQDEDDRHEEQHSSTSNLNKINSSASTGEDMFILQTHQTIQNTTPMNKGTNADNFKSKMNRLSNQFKNTVTKFIGVGRWATRNELSTEIVNDDDSDHIATDDYMLTTETSTFEQYHLDNIDEGVYDILSNYCECRFVCFGCKYITCEQAFVHLKAKKNKDFQTANALRFCDDPNEVYERGKLIKELSSWNKKQSYWMELVIVARAKQDDSFQQALIETYPDKLVHTIEDSFWGIGCTTQNFKSAKLKMYRGRNEYGKILEKIRKDLRLHQKLTNEIVVSKFYIRLIDNSKVYQLTPDHVNEQAIDPNVRKFYPFPTKADDPLPDKDNLEKSNSQSKADQTQHEPPVTSSANSETPMVDKMQNKVEKVINAGRLTNNIPNKEDRSDINKNQYSQDDMKKEALLITDQDNLDDELSITSKHDYNDELELKSDTITGKNSSNELIKEKSINYNISAELEEECLTCDNMQIEPNQTADIGPKISNSDSKIIDNNSDIIKHESSMNVESSNLLQIDVQNISKVNCTLQSDSNATFESREMKICNTTCEDEANLSIKSSECKTETENITILTYKSGYSITNEDNTQTILATSKTTSKSSTDDGHREEFCFEAPDQDSKSMQNDVCNDKLYYIEVKTPVARKKKVALILGITCASLVLTICFAIGYLIGKMAGDNCLGNACIPSHIIPCENAGVTYGTNTTDMTCICEAGRTGTYCEIDIDECYSSPCQNQAVCNNGLNNYTCACAGGWEGINCEINVNECISNPCLNGGVCQDSINQYSCTCDGNWTGPSCEAVVDSCCTGNDVSGLRFVGTTGSYIKYIEDDTWPTMGVNFEITLHFKTLSMNSVLFYAGNNAGADANDFVGAFLQDGKINFACNNVNLPGKVTTSSIYSDGQWHSASFVKIGGTLDLTVDSESLIGETGDDAGDYNSIVTNTDKNYYIGGLGAVDVEAMALEDLGVNTGLDGCIREPKLNGVCFQTQWTENVNTVTGGDCAYC